MKFKDFLAKKSITEDAFSKMEPAEQATLHGEFINELSKAVEDATNKAAEVDALKTQLEELKGSQSGITAEQMTTLEKAVEEYKSIVDKQGERIVELGKTTEGKKMKSLEDAFKAEYDKEVEKTGEGETADFKLPTGKEIRIDTKAIASSDVMAVDTVSDTDFPAAGTTGVVNATIRTIYSKLVGFFGPRIPASKVMDYVDVQPLTASELIAINETTVGTAEVTPECTLKPIVKMTFATQTASAEAVASMWFTTTKLRRYFAALVNKMEQKFAELVNKEIPEVVLTAIRDNATAFTPDAALAINDNPNNYDALGAVIATLENLDYVPNAIFMNPIAWRNMKQEKNAEGIYTLSNGQSIQLVASGLDWGGVVIPYIKDPKLGIDEFIIGDLMETVKAGVDSQLIYMETDGRVDAQANNAATGLARNIRTHVLEKFVAVIVPDGSKSGLIRDTFSNVKTLITAEPTT